MFRIPSFYEDAPSFEDAVRTVKGRANGDLLEGMKSIDALWEDYCAGKLDYEDDMDFFADWCYETNAYNVVFENMSKLLAPKEAA